jgi:hypothetical protein
MFRLAQFIRRVPLSHVFQYINNNNTVINNNTRSKKEKR